MTGFKREYKTIIFKKDISGFAEIILNQPDRHNALSPLMIEELNITFDNLIKDNNISGIIVGNPINMDGSLGRSAQSVNDVASNISKSIDLPVILWDERLSTVGAFNLSSLLDVNVSKRVKTIDQNAAAFILQGAIDFLNN